MKYSWNGIMLLAIIGQTKSILLEDPINFEDAERQEHTDRVAEHLKNQVFNHYHHNVTELNNDIRSNPSNNYNDKEYRRRVANQKGHTYSQVFSFDDPCFNSGIGCDNFNVPNYPPEPPKEGRIGTYKEGKWIIPATPLTTPNTLV